MKVGKPKINPTLGPVRGDLDAPSPVTKFQILGPVSTFTPPCRVETNLSTTTETPPVVMQHSVPELHLPGTIIRHVRNPVKARETRIRVIPPGVEGSTTD